MIFSEMLRYDDIFDDDFVDEDILVNDLDFMEIKFFYERIFNGEIIGYVYVLK